MAKFIIDIPEPVDCVNCDLWVYREKYECDECVLDGNIDSTTLNPSVFIHKDCPLKKVEE